MRVAFRYVDVLFIPFYVSVLHYFVENVIGAKVQHHLRLESPTPSKKSHLKKYRLVDLNLSEYWVLKWLLKMGSPSETSYVEKNNRSLVKEIIFTINW